MKQFSLPSKTAAALTRVSGARLWDFSAQDSWANQGKKEAP